jgi:GT2 family glycosyltransferase/glycosyltransferase involved in cell wall biosynthesis
VSVIIPVFGRVDLTWRCLASIATHAPEAPIEVLVVDDGSPDDTAQRLGGIEHLRLIRLATNQGFIRACNRGAHEAHGRYLLFLNNDTVVGTGWCDELVRTFVDVPNAGIVGAKLIYPDGSLQEAGGIIWKDGSGWNYGRGDDPLKPEYSYRREVDYVSGAALAVPRDLFLELGGFDEHYAPAYGEDSDLAFRVRQAGRTVVYQPLAQVIHEEGATSGRDLATGVKAYQVQNAQKLYARWRHVLEDHGEPGVDVDRAKDRDAGLRVLVLDHCTPTPDQDAGSITALNVMRLLQRLGFKVTFIPESNFLFLDEYTTNLQRMGIECLYAPYVTSVEHHLKEKGGRYDLVVIFRFTAARRHLDAVRGLCPGAKVILHSADIHFIREEREADLRDDRVLRLRAAETKRAELDLVQLVDATIVHSTYEEAVLARECPGAKVVVFGWAIDIPGTTVSFEDREHVALVAGYQHPPNVDAAVYFAHQVFPLIRQRLPGVRFYVVGSRPPDKVTALQSEDVVVTGFVKDLATVLDRMKVTVAPLRYGAGIKGKIGTSMSHGVPCVATTLGAEGMGLVHERHVLIADTPEAIANAVVRLYTDASLWNHLSAAGLLFVREQYSFENGARILRGLLDLIGLEVAGPSTAA